MRGVTSRFAKQSSERMKNLVNYRKKETMGANRQIAHARIKQETTIKQAEIMANTTKNTKRKENQRTLR